MKEIHRKVALITGVGRREGIGYAVASKLAEAGVDILYTYWRTYDAHMKLRGHEIDPAEFVSDFTKLGVRSVCVEADLRDIRTPVLLFEKAVKELGVPDILINNACVSTAQTFTEVTSEILDAHYEVNMRAPLLLCKEFVRHFDKSTGGRIINLTSGQSLGVMDKELPYTVTKAGLEMLTLQLSSALYEKGITLNAIDPGPTDTGWMTDELRAHIISESSRGVINTPKDAATLIMTFIQGDNETVTGRIVHAER